jgi:hypothetical protein
MNITFETFPRPSTEAASKLQAALSATLRRVGRSVWSALVAYGEARARPKLLEIAEQVAITDPELANRIRHAALTAR